MSRGDPCPQKPTSNRVRSIATTSSSSSGTVWPTSSRSSPSEINEGDSFADDLDADSLALIELVEALEEELGERTVGFRIDDEDLEDLKTRARRRRLRRRSTGLSALTDRPTLDALGRPPRVTASPTPSCSTGRVTHRSWCAENPGAVSNERLEFLGDAVLGLVVTDRLFARYPEHAEGELAKHALDARERGDAGRGGRGARPGRRPACWARARTQRVAGPKPSILADALEAVIGAVYLDGGLDAARAFVLDLLADRIATPRSRSEASDSQDPPAGARGPPVRPASPLRDRRGRSRSRQGVHRCGRVRGSRVRPGPGPIQEAGRAGRGRGGLRRAAGRADRRDHAGTERFTPRP